MPKHQEPLHSGSGLPHDAPFPASSLVQHARSSAKAKVEQSTAVHRAPGAATSAAEGGEHQPSAAAGSVHQPAAAKGNAHQPAAGPAGAPAAPSGHARATSATKSGKKARSAEQHKAVPPGKWLRLNGEGGVNGLAAAAPAAASPPSAPTSAQAAPGAPCATSDAQCSPADGASAAPSKASAASSGVAPRKGAVLSFSAPVIEGALQHTLHLPCCPPAQSHAPSKPVMALPEPPLHQQQQQQQLLPEQHAAGVATAAAAIPPSHPLTGLAVHGSAQLPQLLEAEGGQVRGGSVSDEDIPLAQLLQRKREKQDAARVQQAAQAASKQKGAGRGEDKVISKVEDEQGGNAGTISRRRGGKGLRSRGRRGRGRGSGGREKSRKGGHAQGATDVDANGGEGTQSKASEPSGSRKGMQQLHDEEQQQELLGQQKQEQHQQQHQQQELRQEQQHGDRQQQQQQEEDVQQKQQER
eukprot:scaffold51207_cov18-Tisochrysis_lutea.AAC.3